jgi:endonuclease/exonuclease/phosphatase family metal-dependent hydrolase
MKTLLNSRISRQVFATILLTVTILTSAARSQGLSDTGKRGIVVATVNLYVGADFDPVLALDPSDPDFQFKFATGVATIYARIHQSDFQTRADALARQIVMRGPDLVALQEVTLLRRQTGGDSLFGGTVPATGPDLDYLAILMEALVRYGGHYKVVSEIQETDVELPLVTSPTTFDDVRFTDRDVILARTDLPPGLLYTFNPQAKNFGPLLTLPIGLTVLRGWCSIDVQVQGRQFRFINSHLEDRFPEPVPNIQLGQAYELWNGPADTQLPVILAGDFNSDANGNYSPETYSLLTTDAGMRDLWGEVGGRSPGLTWGHDSLLQDPKVLFEFRLDWVLFRGRLEPLDVVVVDPVIGTSSPLWSSDHAAVFGTFAIP